MKRSVNITTPIPSARSTARQLGMSDERFSAIQNIVTGRLAEEPSATPNQPSATQPSATRNKSIATRNKSTSVETARHSHRSRP